MQGMEAVIVTCMIIALTAIRAEAALTAEALRVQVVHQTLRTVVLLMKRVAILLQIARRHIHPAAVLQRKVTAPWILMMKAIMLSMKTVITIGIAIGAMMIMLPVWMMQWRTMTGIGKEEDDDREKGEGAADLFLCVGESDRNAVISVYGFEI